MECPFTGEKDINVKSWIINYKHYYGITYDQAKFQLYFLTFKKLVTKEFLEEYYLNQEYSPVDFIEKFGFPCHATEFLLDYHGIPRRKLSDGHTKRMKDKVRVTSLERYGVEWASQSPAIKQKKENLSFERYGVSSIFKTEGYQERIKKTMMERYGVEHACDLPWYSPKTKRVSAVQCKLNDIINELGYETEMEKGGQIFKRYNEELSRNYAPYVDILLKNHKIVFEMYGEFWHADPNLFKENDIIHKYTGGKTASEIWAYDEMREKHIQNCGYNIFIIWESELKSENLDKTKAKISKLIENVRDDI
jgi:G:T-mismatch repair DNA endonuclease (very short patch repair protein)